jgi:hypothetical protein
VGTAVTLLTLLFALAVLLWARREAGV